MKSKEELKEQVRELYFEERSKYIEFTRIIGATLGVTDCDCNGNSKPLDDYLKEIISEIDKKIK